jgi:hypothetical protein
LRAVASTTTSIAIAGNTLAHELVALLASLVALSPQLVVVADEIYYLLRLLANARSLILAILLMVKVHQGPHLVLPRSHFVDDAFAAILQQELQQGEGLDDSSPHFALLRKPSPKRIQDSLRLIEVV